MIYTIDDLRDKILALRETGIVKGSNTGFRCLDELYSIKPGSFSIFLAAPGHGKSEIIFEILVNQAIKYGKKSLILSPESGNAEEIAMELLHKYLKISAYKVSLYHCDQNEVYAGLNWINHHFCIADDEDKSYSFKSLIKEIGDLERKTNTKFDNIMAEPWNELDHKLALAENSGRQDLSIEDELSELRRYNKKENKHTFLSFHPAYQELVHTKDPCGSYYRMPKAREAAGGQATLRKAFCWLNMWRPPVGLERIDGPPYEKNELLIQVEKSKPKGVGNRGMCSLFFDWEQSRYYEIINGVKSYAFDHEKMPESIPMTIQPSAEFDISDPEIDTMYNEKPPF